MHFEIILGFSVVALWIWTILTLNAIREHIKRLADTEARRGWR